MISTLVISNFLSHKASLLNFSEGVNCIVGPTDSGKSAIIKALKWGIFNRPMGDGMRSSWGGDTCVSINVDGSIVTRFRDGSNGYRLSEEGSDLEFNAIKGDVPIEILKVHNLSDINLQTQFDSHFMLSKSSGEVAQYFNKAAHLDKIDTALQNIQRWIRDLQKKIDYSSESLESNKERLLQYDSLDSIEERLLVLEEKDKSISRLSQDKENIRRILGTIKVVDNQLEEAEFLVELEKTVTDTLEKFNQVKHYRNQKTLLSNAISKLVHINSEIEDVDEKVEEYESEFHEALGKGSICPLCEQVIK